MPTVPMPDPHPHAYSRLYQLREALAAKGFTVKMPLSTLTVIAPVDHGPRFMEEITCHPRPGDGNRPWFWDSQGRPIAEADHITDAVVIIVGMLRPTP